MKVKQNLSKSGFTLIEMIIYFAIFSFLLLILSNVFTQTIYSQLESESLSSVEQDGRYILLRISHDIGEASSIVLPAAAGDSSSTLRIVVGGTNYDYSVVSGNLTLTINQNTYNLNNFNTTISNFNAVRRGVVNGKNTLTITFTITSKIPQTTGFETKSFNLTVGTR